MDLSPTLSRFVLHWGEMGTRWGVNRTVAQIHALLYISGRPMHAEEIADTLTHWVEATDIDGFNLAYAVTPESFDDFVDLVVPELQRRGVYKSDYAPGTYRQKLFGRGPHLRAPHPATTHRVK